MNINMEELERTAVPIQNTHVAGRRFIKRSDHPLKIQIGPTCTPHSLNIHTTQVGRKFTQQSDHPLRLA